MRKRTASTILNRPAIRLTGALALCLFHSFPSALAAPGSWTAKANMPMAFDAHASCEVDGILYVIGGHKDPGVYTQLPTLFAYDPKTDSWTRKTDTWVAKAHLPAARSGVSACAVDGIIYAIGGAIGTISAGNMQRLATVEAYDPKTDQWSPKKALPTPCPFAPANEVNGTIYVFFDTQTFAYDPAANRWTNKVSIPTWSLNSFFTASSVVDGIVYLFGGSTEDGNTTYDLTVAYDPVQNKFTAKRRIPVTCEAAACATIDGKIYHSGGANHDPVVHPAGAAYYDSLWVFDPQGGVAPQSLALTLETTNSVRLTWQGEAGRLYGVQSTPNPAKGPWTRLIFSTGTNSILATNALVEATCPVPSTDPKRFFRVLEAN